MNRKSILSFSVALALFPLLFSASPLTAAPAEAPAAPAAAPCAAPAAAPAAPAAAPAAPAARIDLSGTYNVTGAQAVDKETYEGIGLIKQNGETYTVIYEDSEDKLKGIGIAEAGVFGIAFADGKDPSLVLLKINQDGSLVGHWADKGDTFVSTEKVDPALAVEETISEQGIEPHWTLATPGLWRRAFSVQPGVVFDGLLSWDNRERENLICALRIRRVFFCACASG